MCASSVGRVVFQCCVLAKCECSLVPLPARGCGGREKLLHTLKYRYIFPAPDRAIFDEARVAHPVEPRSAPPPGGGKAHLDDDTRHRATAIKPLRRLTSRLDHRASYHQTNHQVMAPPRKISRAPRESPTCRKGAEGLDDAMREAARHLTPQICGVRTP
jgi:hypothetical protein